MGQPVWLKASHRTLVRSERWELKHLSTSRKRKKISMSKVVAIEMDRAQTGVVTAMPGL